MHEVAIRRLLAALISIVLLAAVYRRYILDSNDPYKCAASLNEGQWLDEPAQRPSRPSYQKWQPPGCLMHEYKADDVSRCAETRQILFIGDSNVRQLFWAVAKKLDRHGALDTSKYAQKYGDIQYAARGVDLRFVWDPYLNGSVLANELQIYQENVAEVVKKGKKEKDAVMIVLGGGLWFARQFESGAVREFKKSMDKIVQFTARPDGSDWQARAPFSGWEGIGDQVFFIPVEDPVYDRLSPARQATIMPEEVDQMNQYLRELTPGKGLTIPWVYQVMTSGKKYAYEQSGLHVLDSIANRRADVILNVRCNAKNDNAIGTPYERTCCSKYTSGNWFQWVLVAVSLVALPAALLLLPRMESPKVTTHVKTMLPSLTAIGLALSYCFFADRSQLFNKVQKVYYQSEFLTMVSLAFAIGLLTIHKTKDALLKANTKDVFVASEPSFLCRDQTDEWKGWMQVVVLAYHWTAASKIPTLHITMRLMVGAYLFLTGYGHTMYFYRTRDYSLARVSSILVRLNLLTIALCYQMYTNYLFYIFTPLITFWFLVIYITLRFGAELNHKADFLAGKMAMSAAFVALAHNYAQPTDTMFSWIRSVFGMDWNASDWRRHVSMDGLIVFLGMIVALLHLWYRNIEASPKSYQNDMLPNLFHKVFPHLRIASIVASAIIMPGFYLVMTHSCNQKDYDWWHPRIAFLPILSYVVIRNCHPLLRNYHSAAFAWLGRSSLETWLLSHHVLRAADAHGVLSIGIFKNGDGTLWRDRSRDYVLLAPILVWVAWNVSVATKEVVKMSLQENVAARFAGLLVGLWILNMVTG